MTDISQLDDDDLVERLRRLATTFDPVPDEVLEAGRRAFALGLFDQQLADLLFDSQTDDVLAGQRGTGARQLTFSAGELTLDVDVDAEGIAGQSSDAIERVELQTESSTVPLDVDELGRFFGGRPAESPFRLRISRPTGDVVVTEWVTL